MRKTCVGEGSMVIMGVQNDKMWIFTQNIFRPNLDQLWPKRNIPTYKCYSLRYINIAKRPKIRLIGCVGFPIKFKKSCFLPFWAKTANSEQILAKMDHF